MLSPLSLTLTNLSSVPLSIDSKQSPSQVTASFSEVFHTIFSEEKDELKHYSYKARPESVSTISVLSAPLSTSTSVSSVPSLQSDLYEAKIERPVRKPKIRKSHSVELVECPADHPLIPKTPYIKAGSLLSVKDENAILHSSQPIGNYRALEDKLVIAERTVHQDLDMALLSRRVSIMLNETPRRHVRANSQYLRMYCAEREMLLKNKISFIPSQPVLLPRADTNKPGATQVELGIALGWHKSRPRRFWRELNANDFS